jgi:hypothetical protein
MIMSKGEWDMKARCSGLRSRGGKESKLRNDVAKMMVFDRVCGLDRVGKGGKMLLC